MEGVRGSSPLGPTIFIMKRNPELDTLRHSCSHVLAQAVKELWPDVRLAIGPAIESGFYYDFDKKEPFAQEDLKKIEKTMQRIIAQRVPLQHSVMPKADAIAMFSKLKEDFKVEMIQDLPGEEVSIYRTGDAFLDLCKGPHVDNTERIKAFKLLSIAGAYWRGDERKPMLQRIYGTCFFSQGDLKEFLQTLEEAQKRDHRKLGPQLDLFHVYPDEAGAGLIFYHPAGAMLRNIIEEYVRGEHLRRGYELVATPHILKGNLWEQSGHADHYRQNMYYFNVDNEEYAVKPMNCPGHILIYKSKRRSYRELPIRYFELGTVYRREKAGVLHGLLRVRGFTQDDAHIFCRPDQIQSEVMQTLDFAFDTMRDFGFENFEIELSTIPEDHIGSLGDWEKATEALENSLKEKGIDYQRNEGEGAFYGPKIDIKLKDALGRAWQCATIQCDFSLPERFGMTYVVETGEPARPIMIHRAILGSIERFIGTLIEHYSGAFPVWLAPTQVRMIPIKTEHTAFAEQVKSDLQNKGIRVIIDYRNESLNKRIREGTLTKVPYILIIGDKEIKTSRVAVRRRAVGDQGSMTIEDFVKQIKQEIKEKQ